MRLRLRQITQEPQGFNPRICKRCDLLLQFVLFTQQVVSIHASVKDATLHLSSHHRRPEVSIHASVKDATRQAIQYQLLLLVSIHASVKDATQASKRIQLMRASFNPRICKRCDTSQKKYRTLYAVSIHASVKDATFDI